MDGDMPTSLAAASYSDRDSAVVDSFENILFFVPDGLLMSSKWHNVKAVLRYCEAVDQPSVEPQFPMFFDIGSDPGERYDLFDYKLDMGWMFGIALAAIAEYEKSVVEFPSITPGEEFEGYPAAAS